MSETRILIVDDDPDIRSNMQDILGDLGYRTDVAHDGPSAMHLAAETEFDIALLDYKMPGINGITLFRNLKNIQPDIVAFMITAYPGSDGPKEARGITDCRVLQKPVEPSMLIELIGKC